MSTNLYRTLASLALPLAVASVSLGQLAQPPNPGVQKDTMAQPSDPGVQKDATAQPSNQGVQKDMAQPSDQGVPKDTMAKPSDPSVQKDATNQLKTEAATPVRASKLIGMEVYNRQDKEVGKIKDVVLDQDGKNIGYTVVSYGGFLGMGDKLFAVPYRNLQYSGTKDSKVYTDLDEQALKNGPGFNQDKWPEKADSTAYYKQADQYYDKYSTAQPAAGRMDGAGAAPMTEGLTWNRRLSALMGANVHSPTGEKLGDIKDVIIDWKTGKVQYEVLSFGGVMGLGDKLFAIPSTALQTKPDSKELILAIDKQRLKDAPGFDKNNWPNFSDESWQKTNDQFYSAQPGVMAPETK